MSKKDTAQILPAEMQAFEQTCREWGMRVTHQRLEIFRELASAKGHPSAEEIYNRVHKRLPSIALDTVYRTIDTFENMNLVKRVKFMDNRTRFDTNIITHHHLVCTECNRIEDFYWPAFDNLKVPDTLKDWGVVDTKHAEIRGLCRKCRNKIKK
jgi:Fur family peroxide stress response transcriptional regulator